MSVGDKISLRGTGGERRLAAYLCLPEQNTDLRRHRRVNEATEK